MLKSIFNKSPFIALGIVSILNSCNLIQKQDATADKNKTTNSTVKEIEKSSYKPSQTRVVDLLHTKLDVRLDWEKQHLIGTASLVIKPYFKTIKEVTLDAKGMEISKVGWLDKDGGLHSLSFKNDSLKLYVTLDKAYSRKDTFELYIQYTAKPNELNNTGSKAIKENKGLYFINPLNKINNKPQQVWTQGEPEANSCWFPTIDAPNEKMTQEIYLTVDQKFTTLSNGLLVSTKLNGDGTKTDYWRQVLPHTPYLTMIAVGDFVIVKDKWKDIEVNYYVEKKDSSDAKLNFGNTPEMLQFYSDKLGVEYPWDKYHQIVVTDFVSGAMENTGAVIHNKVIFRSKEQLIDYDREDVIAHELMHHWFGDLVTCESWANITLNEGFASYGEYLWIEYKYGIEQAQRHLYHDKNTYIADQPYHELINFHYDVPMDVFDRHSYQKGALVLHSLRHFLGDDAFFEGIKYYLTQNAFQSVEVHDFRIAMEKISGEDLNWFFNQWFLESGHPILKVDYSHTSDSLIINVSQVQDLTKHQLFEFPLPITIYNGSKKEEKELMISKEKETFIIKTFNAPDLVSFDPSHVICGEIVQKLTPEMALFKYKNENHFSNKMISLDAIRGDTSVVAYELISSAIKDKDDYVRRVTSTYWSEIPDGKSVEFKEQLLQIIKSDSVALVRRTALRNLANNFQSDSTLIPVYKEALNDSSYLVKSEAIKALFKIKREDALLRAVQLEKIEDPSLIYTLATLYKDINDESKVEYYRWALDHTEGYYKEKIVQLFQEYLVAKSTATIHKGLKTLNYLALNESSALIREEAGMAMFKIYEVHLKRIKDIEKDIADKEKSTKGNSYDLKMLKEKLEELKLKKEELKESLNKVLNSEISKSIIKNWKAAGFSIESINKD